MAKDEIKLDPKNYRVHDEENKKVVKKSIKENGFGRSILLDSSDTIIAGNQTFESSQELGLPVRVIETDGTEVIALKRTDLKTDDPKRVALAIADNSSSDSSTFDFDFMIEDGVSDIAEEYGVSFEVEDDRDDADNNNDQLDKSDSLEEKYEVVVQCKGELQQEEIFLRLTNEGYKCRVLTL